MKERIILDLCGGTGSWSKPYQDAGYDVRLIDPYTVGLWSAPEQVEIGGDVRLVKFPDFPVHGVLAAPPCTAFSLARNRNPANDEELRSALSVVDACLRLIVLSGPAWWALENPLGKLRRYLGPERLLFNPFDYGDPYQKRTLLWGRFTVPKKNPVEPTNNGRITNMPGGDKRRARTRAITPSGFAGAFFEANP